ncbi:MAG: hypothetical protein KIT09_16200 [Bryobacteraceae bacterium]|nr:hypothetical protein [Bryobacteraceae bacterium]
MTDVSVWLEKLIAELPDRAHLVSVFGNDQEIGAVAAGLMEEARFRVTLPEKSWTVSLGEKPALHRASLQIPGRKRPVRHLIAISREFADTTMAARKGVRRTVLYDEAPAFVMHRLAVRFGLPVLPEWGEWFHAELAGRNLIEPLLGWNCTPVLVRGGKGRLLNILSQGLKQKAISIPEDEHCIEDGSPAAAAETALGAAS